MSDLNLQDTLWWLDKSIKKLGAWGILGIVILVLSFSVYSAKVAKLNASLAHLKANNVNVAVQNTRPLLDSQQNGFQQINAFYQTLPSTKALPTILLKINKVASAQHLSLNQGDYKFNQVHDHQISQSQAIAKYEVIFPVQGQYSQVRNFISQTMYALPYVALVDLNFKRENTQMAEVEADLIFVIYMKEDPL